MKEIEKYLPQREPFLFVDKILSASLEEIVAVKTYDEAFIFVQKDQSGSKYVPLPILFETVVQAGGAGINMLQIGEGHVFALAAVKTANMHNFLHIPSTVTMKINTVKAQGKVLRQKGSVWSGENLVLEAEWSCMFLFERGYSQ